MEDQKNNINNIRYYIKSINVTQLLHSSIFYYKSEY